MYLSSFIIRFHSARMDNLLQTLRFLELLHLDVIEKSELILVCQDSVDGIFNKFASSRQFNMNLENMSMAKTTNFGVEKSSSDKLVLLDSDRILPKGYFKEMIQEVETGKMITTLKMIKLLNPTDDEDIINRNFEWKNDNRNEGNGVYGKTMWSGNTTFMKSDYIACGGMDENYNGYGGDDCDMTENTLQHGIEHIYDEKHTEVHLWHEGQTYGNGDQKQLFHDNMLYFLKKWSKPIPQWFKDEVIEHKKVKFLI